MAFIPSDGVARSIAVPSALVVGEAVRWTVPFGGVPMSNLALGPIDTYLVDVVRVGGALLLVGAIGIVAVAVEGALSARLRTVLGALVAIVVLIAVAVVKLPLGLALGVPPAAVLGARAAPARPGRRGKRKSQAAARRTASR